MGSSIWTSLNCHAPLRSSPYGEAIRSSVKTTAGDKSDVTAYLMDLDDQLGGLDTPLGADNAEDITIGAR